METRDYEKRVRRGKLASHEEHKALSFSIGITAAMCLVALLSGYNATRGSIGATNLAIAGIFLLNTLLQIGIRVLFERQVLAFGEAKRWLRLMGVGLLPFVLLGNVFSFIAGMMLLQREKSVEYKLCVYMILTNLTIIVVSLLNLAKGQVADTFWLGIIILAAITGFYVVVTILTTKFISGRTVHAGLKWLVLPVAATSLTGNIYAFFWGLIIFRRLTQTNKEASVKWIDIMRRLFRNYTALIGLFIVVFLISVSIYSNLTFDYDVAIDSDYSAILVAPCLKYPFGTDNFGRCMFTRIVSGAKISLLMGLATTSYPMAIGVILGAFAGYRGGYQENLVMRGMDILAAIPGMLLAIVVISSLGSTIPNMVIALGLVSISSYARAVRAQVLNISNAEFVEAARAYGAGDFTIVLRHIVPNSLTPVIVSSTSMMGQMVLSTSALSYLGIGLPTHLPEWGNILRLGSTYLETHSYLAIFPGLAIVAIVLAFNFFGDGVRDALDPKFK